MLLKANVELSARKIDELLSKIWKSVIFSEAWRTGLNIEFSKKGSLKEYRYWRVYNPTVYS